MIVDLSDVYAVLIRIDEKLGELLIQTEKQQINITNIGERVPKEIYLQDCDSNLDRVLVDDFGQIKG